MVETLRFEALARRAVPGCRLLRVWKLTGGVSAEATGLEVASADGLTMKLVVRRHGEADRRRNPHIARDEFRLLETLHAARLAVPRPIFLDVSRDISDVPYLVMEYVEGDVDFSPTDLPVYLRRLAAELARIHSFDISRAGVSFLPDQLALCDLRIGRRPERLNDLAGEIRIRDFLESSWPVAQRNPSALLHGDYWQGNIIWRDGEVAAVIDWEDAAIGDPLCDLGKARLEILWGFGEKAMRDFTDYYLLETSLDTSTLPYWDLYSALRLAGNIAGWGLPEKKVRLMAEQLKWFVEQAISEATRR
jgi:aminoglycoside phosphotransferase (APT) family kinase protein